MFVPEPLFDSDEAAAFIRIHPKTLQRFAREGQIQGIHIGSCGGFASRHWRSGSNARRAPKPALRCAKPVQPLP